MAIKYLITCLSVVAVTYGFVIPLGGNRSGPSGFAYSVTDHATGDFKGHSETRIGNSLRGQYSFLQPDGLRRIVDYFSDATGFHATVKYVPTDFGAPVAPVQILPEPAEATPVAASIRAPIVVADQPIVTPIFPASAYPRRRIINSRFGNALLF